MPKFVFESCCCCIDLRKGCFIIGYLNAIGSVLTMISAIIGVAGGVYLAYSPDPHNWEIGNMILATSIVSLLIVTALFAFSVVLLVGLHKNKPNHVYAFLIYNTVYIVISIILLIINVVGPFTWEIIVARIIEILFNIYIILVLRSYYFKMKEEPARVATYSSS